MEQKKCNNLYRPKRKLSQSEKFHLMAREGYAYVLPSENRFIMMKLIIPGKEDVHSSEY